MKTYIEQCKDKSIELSQNSLDDFVDFWHTSEQTRNITLHAAIGISWDEYRENMSNSEKIMKLLKSKIST